MNERLHDMITYRILFDVSISSKKKIKQRTSYYNSTELLAEVKFSLKRLTIDAYRIADVIDCMEKSTRLK